MGERLGKNGGRPDILLLSRTKPQPIRWVLGSGAIRGHPQDEAGPGERRLLCINRQSQIILPLGVQKIDPGCVKWLVRFDLKHDLSSLEATQIALPLSSLWGAARIVRKTVFHLADQQ